MKSLVFNRITLVWFFLAGATLASWEIGHGMGFRDIRYASTCVMVLALIKMRYVLLEFMELRHAPGLVRLVVEVWVVVVCAILLIFYWLGLGISG